MHNAELGSGGAMQGSALHPLKPFFQEGFENPKNFQKSFLRVFLLAV